VKPKKGGRGRNLGTLSRILTAEHVAQELRKNEESKVGGRQRVKNENQT